MSKIAIIGCGNVGLSYVFSLINSILKIEELILIDIDQNKLEGNLFDLNHASIALNRNISIKKGNYNDCTNADIVCITAGTSQNNMKTRVGALDQNNHIMTSIVKEVKNSGFQGIYLIASNPLDIMCYTAWKNSDLPYNKIIGSGTLLETSRLKYFISQKLSISPHDVDGYVLGEHGDTQFVVWSQVKIQGKNATELLSIEERNEISMQVRNAGYHIVEKTGATHYGIAGCLKELTIIILNKEQKILPISCYNPDFDLYISSLALLTSEGVQEINKIFLTEIEQEQYKSSANFLRNFLKNLS